MSKEWWSVTVKSEPKRESLSIRWRGNCPTQVAGDERSLKANLALDRAVSALVRAKQRVDREAERSHKRASTGEGK